MTGFEAACAKHRTFCFFSQLSHGSIEFGSRKPNDAWCWGLALLSKSHKFFFGNGFICWLAIRRIPGDKNKIGVDKKAGYLVRFGRHFGSPT
jgi:hypothetical protein